MKRIILSVFLLMSVLFVVAVPVALAASPRAEGCPDGPFDDNGEPRNLTECKCTYVDIQEETYCLSGEESLAIMIRDMIRMWLIGAAKAIAAFFWLLIRLVAIICDALLRGEIWQDIRNAILEQLESILGGRDGVLYQVIGPSNGLFALAIMLAGLLMTFPLLAAQTSRLVRIERVLPWGVLLIGLFIASSAGFDLVEFIEDLRVDMVQAAAGIGTDGSSNLLNLVAAPMQATPEETLRLSAETLWQLPAGFERAYFPEADYIVRRVVVTDLAGDVLDLVFRGEMLEPASYTRMTARAGEALFKILVSTVSLYDLSLLALTYLVLFAAALFLIIYLLSSLPLGFFEFGGALHMKIVSQYVAVVGLSLFVAVLVRILTATTISTMTDAFDFANLATYFVTHLVIAVMLTMAFKMAWNIMDGSLGIMQTVVSSVGAMAVSTSGPIGGSIEFAKRTASTAVTAATGAVAGFVTGGAAGALMGGIGGLMSNAKAGPQAADALASQAPDSQAVQSFAAAARSGGSPVQAATGIIAARRPFAKLDGDSADTGQSDTVYYSAPVNPKWQAVDCGPYLAADLSTLEQAEKSYFHQMNPGQARHDLRTTFGSDALADEVMGLYGEQGPTGARWVRGVSEAAQIAADETRNAGQQVFDASGRPTDSYQSRLMGEFEQRHLANTTTPSFPSAQRIANASIRQPQNVWQQPTHAPRLLTRATLDPERGEVQVEDISAQYALHDLALKEGWDRPEQAPRLECVFQAYHHVRQNTPSEHIQPEQVYDAMRQDDRLEHERPDALHEAARLVTLVGDPAAVQRGAEEPERQVILRDEDEDLIFSMPHSDDLNQRLFDEIPTTSRTWDETRREWHIEADYAQIAHEIVQVVADEHGWQVQPTDETEESTLPANENSVEKPPVSSTVPIPTTHPPQIASPVVTRLPQHQPIARKP